MSWLGTLLLLAVSPALAALAARSLRPYLEQPRIPLRRQLLAGALLFAAWGLAMGSSLFVIGQLPELVSSLLGCLDFGLPFLTFALRGWRGTWGRLTTPA